MKRWLIGFFLCSLVVFNSDFIYADAATTTDSAKTEITAKLVKPISSSELPGVNPTSSNKQNSSTSAIASSAKQLPKTNETSNLSYSLLGSTILIVTSMAYFFKKKNEGEN